VKLGKPKQDTRFDVPVFGLQTLQYLSEANIKNVALESGSVLLLNKGELVKEAKKLGIGIKGVKTK
jgi:DUF1009 family protein